MEIILYYIEQSKSLLISFLILIFFLGVFLYIGIRNFSQDKKLKVIIYGLFLKLNNIDIIKLSIVILKEFLFVYSLMTRETRMIWLCIIMICILTVVYLILARKKIITELLTTGIQLVMIYFIFTMNNYLLEVENSPVILTIKTILTVFALLSIAYLLFTNVNTIAEIRMDKEIKKGQKVQDK
jgi:hypothetical protein